MSDNKQATNSLLKGIQYLIKEEINKAPIDQTLTGVIKNVKEDNLYDVSIDGRLYNNIPSIFKGFTANNTVKIKVPQGQFSQMYISGKYNMDVKGGSGEKNVTSVNGQVGDVIVVEDKNYIHKQLSASDTWVINHNLEKFPSVIIVDSGNNVVIGNIQYNSLNQITVKFNGSFSGNAYLN